MIRVAVLYEGVEGVAAVKNFGAKVGDLELMT